jgi:hypothetical protein
MGIKRDSAKNEAIDVHDVISLKSHNLQELST